MKFYELTDNDIKKILYDIFECKKVTCIKHYKKFDEISCKMYTEWYSKDDNGEEIVDTIADEIILRNPFDYSIYDAIDIGDFDIHNEDYIKLKQFCYAKGIYGESIEWLFNNPYMNK